MATRPVRPLPIPPVTPHDSKRMIGVLSLVMRTLNFPFPPEAGKDVFMLFFASSKTLKVKF